LFAIVSLFARYMAEAAQSCQCDAI